MSKKKIFLIIGIVLAVILAAVAAFLILNKPGQGEDTGGEAKITTLLEGKIKTDQETDFKIVNDNGDTVLTAEDIETLFLSITDGKNRYLEFCLTDSGAKAFKDAISNGETLKIMIKGSVLKYTVDGVETECILKQDDLVESSAIFEGDYNSQIITCFGDIATPIVNTQEELDAKENS